MAASARQSAAAAGVAMFQKENMKWNNSVGVLTKKCVLRHELCWQPQEDSSIYAMSNVRAAADPYHRRLFFPNREGLESIRSRLSNPVLKDANPAV